MRQLPGMLLVQLPAHSLGQALGQAVDAAVTADGPVVCVALEVLGLGVQLAVEPADAEATVTPESAKGLTPFPPLAVEKSKANPPWLLCCTMLSDVSSEFSGLPCWFAQIQPPELDVKSISPPFQLLQFEPEIESMLRFARRDRSTYT